MSATFIWTHVLDSPRCVTQRQHQVPDLKPSDAHAPIRCTPTTHHKFPTSVMDNLWDRCLLFVHTYLLRLNLCLMSLQLLLDCAGRLTIWSNYPYKAKLQKNLVKENSDGLWCCKMRTQFKTQHSNKVRKGRCTHMLWHQVLDTLAGNTDY